MKKNSYQEDIRDLLDWVYKEEERILSEKKYLYQDNPDIDKLHRELRDKFIETRKKHGLKPFMEPKNKTK